MRKTRIISAPFYTTDFNQPHIYTTSNKTQFRFGLLEEYAALMISQSLQNINWKVLLKHGN